MKTTAPQLYYFRLAGRVYPAQTFAEFSKGGLLWSGQVHDLDACKVGTTAWQKVDAMPELAPDVAALADSFRWSPAPGPTQASSSPAIAPAAPVSSVPAFVRCMLILLLVFGIVFTMISLDDEIYARVPATNTSVINLPAAHDQTIRVMIGCFCAAAGLLGLLIYRPAPPAA